MVIKEVLYAGGGVTQLTAGATSILTSNAPTSGTGLAGTSIPTIYDKAARSSMAWFEGRLWTAIVREVGGNIHLQPRRWDASLDEWQASPDSATYTNSNANSSDLSSSPGIISFKDGIHFFYITNDAPLFGGSTEFNLQHALWQPDPAPNGASTTGTTVAFPTSGSYTKPGGGAAAIAGVHHAVEFNGTLYVALGCGVVSGTLTGGLAILDSLAGGSAVSDMTAKSFGCFTPTDGLKQLFMVDNSGLVQLAAPFSTVADLTSINANITPGPTDSVFSGYAPACVQVGTEFFVFMVDSTGAVMFKSSNPIGGIGTFTEVTGDLPVAWQTNLDTHTHTQVDPSNDEVRIMFKDHSSDQFEVYSFDGTTFTLLGGSTITSTNYSFFDPSAADVEIEEVPTVDSVAGTTTINYLVFNETIASGFTAEAEYSTDNGGTWIAAQAAAGSDGITAGSSGTITGLTADDSRPSAHGSSFTFVWAFENDLGSGVFTNVRFRIRST